MYIYTNVSLFLMNEKQVLKFKLYLNIIHVLVHEFKCVDTCTLYINIYNIMMINMCNYCLFVLKPLHTVFQVSRNKGAVALNFIVIIPL